MELLTVDSLETAFQKLADASSCLRLPPLCIAAAEAVGMALREDLFCDEDVPGFTRSTVDGYAVHAKDTAAAGESVPVLLQCVGKVEMGRRTDLSLLPGQCAEVPTGAMLPGGADAVVMAEYAELFGAGGVAVCQSAAPGENVVLRGEDARAGTLLLPRGTRIGPKEIGALAAAGVDNVPVTAPPKLAIISTGDELSPPGTAPGPGQVRDVNTPALAALAAKNGFSVAHTAVMPDDEALLAAEVQNAMSFCDIVAVSGGSSKGAKDATRAVFERTTAPGVFTHGIALKPGKPTILAVDYESRTLLAGLPGHPVSAMVVFELLFSRLWRHITGTPEPPAVPAALTVNVASSPGKTTCWPVRLLPSESGGWLAEPVFGKSGLITTLANADGYITAHRDDEGLLAGCSVMVHLF